MAANAAYWAFAAATAVSVGTSIDASNQQKKANRAQRSAQRGQALRERQQQIRQERIARARAENQAIVGGGEGSVLSSAVGSISNQAASNRAFISSVDNRNQQSFRADQRASTLGNISNISGQLASFSTNFMGGGSSGKAGANKDLNKLMINSGLF